MEEAPAWGNESLSLLIAWVPDDCAINARSFSTWIQLTVDLEHDKFNASTAKLWGQIFF